MAAALSFCSLSAKLNAAVQMPVRLFATDAIAVEKSISVPVPSAVAGSAEYLYLQVHGLRYGGQVSIKLNTDDWLDVYNDSVTVIGGEAKQAGIGGMSSTIRFLVDVSSQTVNTSNTVAVRLNGTDGNNTAIRVLDVDFLDSNFEGLVAAGEILSADSESVTGETGADAAQWSPYSTAQANLDNGKNYWEGDSSIFELDHNNDGTDDAYLLNDPLNQDIIVASCASCHFDDGSDLAYFNYSNDSIVSRAMFHGLDENDAKDIASYIRSLVTEDGAPNPGRPWNPPFQPGPGLDPDAADSAAQIAEKGENWMAGAGLDAVAESEEEIKDALFPNGTSAAEIAKLMDHEGTLSVREVPLSFQLPDWNRWLPIVSLEDIWVGTDYAVGETEGIDTTRSVTTITSNSCQTASTNTREGPLKAKETFRSLIDSGGAATLASNGLLGKRFGDFERSINLWLNKFRLNPVNGDSATKYSEVMKAAISNTGLSRGEITATVGHWMSVKVLDGVRANDIELIGDDPAAMLSKHPNYTEELMNIPGDYILGAVFSNAPHIASENYTNFEGQTDVIGKIESSNWYTLQLILNAGNRVVGGLNVPIDWDYQLNHLIDVGERTGDWRGMTTLTSIIKMLQCRDNGDGVTKTGFSQRTLHPYNFFSNDDRARTMHKGALDAVEPDLWRKLFEEFTYEWFDVVTEWGYDDSTYVPRGSYGSGLEERHFFDETGRPPLPYDLATESLFFRSNGPVTKGVSSVSWFYRLLPLLYQDGVDPLLVEDLRDYCKLLWVPTSGTEYWYKGSECDGSLDTYELVNPYTDSNGNTGWEFADSGLQVPAWDSLFTSDTIFEERFEDTAGHAFDSNTGPLTQLEIRDSVWKTKTTGGVPDAPLNGGARYVGYSDIGANSNVYTRNPNVPISLAASVPGGSIEVSARIAYDSLGDANPGEIKFRFAVLFDNSGWSYPDWMVLDSDLDGNEFVTYRATVNVDASNTAIKRIMLTAIRTGGTQTAKIYYDNVSIREVKDRSIIADPGDANYDYSGDGARMIADTSGNYDFVKCLVKWKTAVPPSLSDQIAGYNIYRWVNGEAESTAIKVNQDLFDRPYRSIDGGTGYVFMDFTVKEDTTYKYKVEAVDFDGAVVSGSASTISDLAAISDVEDPLPTATLDAFDTSTPGSPEVTLVWFGVPTWDIDGFHVFRKDLTSGETISTKMNTDLVKDLDWVDTSVTENHEYRYYIRSVDVNGYFKNSIGTKITVGQ